MNYFYQLSIENTDRNTISEISKILGEDSLSEDYWIINHKDESSEELYYDYISYYLDLLEGKLKDLKKIGIANEDISIWIFYECAEQFNYEFDPEVLKRIGDYGVSLCISCFESTGHRASE